MLVTTHSIFFRRWAIGKQTLQELYVPSEVNVASRYAILTIVFHLIFHFLLGVSFGTTCFYIVCRALWQIYSVFLGTIVILFFTDIKFSLPCHFLKYFTRDWKSYFRRNQPFYKRLSDTKSSYQPYEKATCYFPHTKPRTRNNHVVSFRSYFWMLFSTCWEAKAMRFNILASTIASVTLRAFHHYSKTWDSKTIGFLLQEVFFSFPTPFWSFKILIHPLIFFILFQCIIQTVFFFLWMLRLAIEQPNFIQENRLTMRTSQIACYASEQEACFLNRQTSSHLCNLTSVHQSLTLSFFQSQPSSVSVHSSWYVACFPNLHSIPPDCHTNRYAYNIWKTSKFQKTEPAWNVWYPIPFPLNSEVIPFPTKKPQNSTFSYLYEKINPPIYTNIPYPFTCDPPFITKTLLSTFNHQRGSPFTCYLCSFETPWTRTNENCLPVVSLIIQGCGPAFYVFLNGQYIGYSTDTFLSSEFLVSTQLHWTCQTMHASSALEENISLNSTNPSLKSGSTTNDLFEGSVRNTLLLVVPRWCASSYLEDQDHWWFSGCFRDVELMRWPLEMSDPLCEIRESGFEQICYPLKNVSSVTQRSLTKSLRDTRQTQLCIEDFSVSTQIVKSESLCNLSKGYVNISLMLATKLMTKQVCHYEEDIRCERNNEVVFHSLGLSKFALQARLFFCGCPARKEPGTGDSKRKDKTVVSPLDFSSYNVEDLNIEWDFVKNSKQVAFKPATPLSADSITMKSATHFLTHLQLTIDNPMLWCDESPYVYMVCISLVHMNSCKRAVPSFLQCEATLLGFTHVSLHSSQLCINGRPCLLKGVNRHEHHPFKGKHTPYATILDDLLLIKQYNFNSIRTSHYPNTPFFYFLCTLLGIYVVDEANIETHGDVLFAWNRFLSFLTVRLPLYPLCRLANDPDWKLPWLNRISRMVLRDANNPCIILWSTGNEAGCGAWPREAKNLITKLSKTSQYRPVQYEPGHSPLDSSDIFCPMYMPFKQVQNYARHCDAGKKKKWFQCPSRPLILCEYQHAMGNSNGDLDKYWEAFDTYPSLQGGFIWDFADQGLLQSKLLDDQSTVYHWAYGGDFANDTIDKNFNHNGLLYADRRLKPGIIEAKYVQQPIVITFDSVTCSESMSSSLKKQIWIQENPHQGSVFKNVHVTLKVLNKQIYNDLEHFECHYSLTSLDHVCFLRSGTISLPEKCKPSSSAFLHFQEPNLPSSLLKQPLSLILHITLNKNFLWAKKGHSVARCQLFIDIPSSLDQVTPFFPSPKLPHLLYFSLPAKHPSSWHAFHSQWNFKTQMMNTTHNTFWFVRRLFIQNTKDSCCSHRKNLQEWSLQPLKTKLKTAQPVTPSSPFVTTSFLLTSFVSHFNVYEIFNYNNVSIFIHCESGVFEGLSIQYPYPSSNSTYTHSVIQPSTKPTCSFHSILYGPIHYNFVRAPTDNDQGGINVSHSPFTMLPTVGILGALWGAAYWFTNPSQNVSSYYSSWKKAGLDQMEPSLIDFKIFFNDSIALRESCIQLQVIQKHTPKHNITSTTPATTLSSFLSSKMSHDWTKSYFQTKSTYTLYYNGLCQLDSSITPLPALFSLRLPSIPRIGLAFCLPPFYQNVAYRGLGPHENYCDRNASTIMSVFTSTVDAMYEPYTVPCENGNRGNVQWISLMQPSNPTSSYLHGLLVLKKEKNDPPIECSIQPFSLSQVTIAKHQSDLGVSIQPRRPYSFEEDKNNHLGSNQDLTHQTCTTLFRSKKKYRNIHLFIDAKQMGVGGECSWLPCLDNHSKITLHKQNAPMYSPIQIPSLLLVPIYQCQNNQLLKKK